MGVLKKSTNKKLGACYSYSRPVGPTCPPSCPFMTGIVRDLAGNKVGEIPSNLRCYANKGACSWPSTKKAWLANVRLDVKALTADLVKAGRTKVPVRIHVGGDFGQADGEGRIDQEYVGDLLYSLRSALDKGPLPPVWVYTHLWLGFEPYLASFRALGVQVFASVHTPDEFASALAKGYRLAIDSRLESFNGTHASFEPEGGPVVSALVCPEQRLGPDKIDCRRCGYCYRDRPTQHVAFLRH